MGLGDKKLLSKRQYQAYALAWLIILLGWLFVLNYLSNKVFYRLDLTEGKAYTLSKATKNVLKDLKQPVTITAYLSSNLPAMIRSDLGQIQNLLNEYQVYGRGRVKFKAVNPEGNPELQDELRSRGIEPIPYQVRGASELSLRQGYMAVEINYLDQHQVFPNVIDLKDFEYAITSALLKISSEKEIGVGFLSGHNEPDSFKALKTLREAVERQYLFSVVSNAESVAIPEDVNVLLVVSPQKVPDQDKYELDQFIMRGGKVIFLLDGVEVAEEYLMAFPKEDGLDDLLENYGVKRNHDLVMDLLNEKVAFRQGIFQLVQPYPLWVKVNIPVLKKLELAPDNQVINSLDSVVLPWVSSLEPVKGKEGIKVSELLKSSPKSWVQAGQFSLDPNKMPPPMPFAEMGEKSRTLAVLLQGSFKSLYANKPKPAEAGAKSEEKSGPEKLDQSPENSMVVVGNGRFVKDDYLNLGDSNLDFVLNAIDWMTWGGKLIGVRSRVSIDRPFSESVGACLAERSCSSWDIIRILFARTAGPFLLPIAVIIYGLVRFQVRRRAKKAWAAGKKEPGK